MKKFLKYFSILFIGFIGGCLSPMFLSLFNKIEIGSLDQAVSIANTYIVFTTIFFVGITVLLSIGGYVISQQLAVNRKQLEKEANEQLLKRIRYSESIATEILDQVFHNSDFRNNLEKKVQNHVEQAVQYKIQQKQETTRSANAEVTALAELLQEMQLKE